MFKLIFLIFLLFGTCYSLQPLKFIFGKVKAALQKNNDGMMKVQCSGGSGKYNYLYGNLPVRWSQQGNSLRIPDILNLNLSVIVRVRIQDEKKNVLEDYVKIAVDGLDVKVMAPYEPVVNEKQEKKEQKKQEKQPIVLDENQKENKKEEKTYYSEEERDVALHRQKKAQEAVANLISIIQQIKANINYVKSKIQEFQKKQEEKSNSFKVCSEEEINLDEKKVDLSLKLKERSAALVALEQELRQKESDTKNEDEQEKLVAEKVNFQEKRQITQTNLKNQQSEFNSCEVVHQGYHRQYDEVNARLQQISATLETQNEKATKSPQTISQIDQKLIEKDAEIEGLKKQLSQAENAKKELQEQRLKEELAYAATKESIRQLKESQQGIQKRLPDLIDNIGYYHPKCGKMEEDLKTAKEKYQKEVERYEQVLVRIEELNILIQDKNEHIKQLKVKVYEDKELINKISEELAVVEKLIPPKQKQCSLIASSLQQIKNQLQNLNKRLQEQKMFLDERNLQLQKARAEKELADISVQEIIQATANVKKYPVEQKSDFESLQKLFLPKTLTEVLAEKKSYPLSPISKKALSGDYNQPIRLPQFSCDKKGSFYEGSGKVVGFRQGRIEVENDKGDILPMSISSCSQLKATEANHILSKNDSVKYKVRRNSQGGFELQSLVCEV